MPTQLESLINALEESGRPMTASELAAVIVKNGSKAERPENTVLSLVHRCKDIVNIGSSPARYALREWNADGTVPSDPIQQVRFWGSITAHCLRNTVFLP